MQDQKVFVITDDNGVYYDFSVGDESKREEVKKTKQFIDECREESWLKTRIVELPIEGKIHKGHTNIITTIKLNNTPFRAIANSFHSLVEIVENYMDLESEYRKYTYYCEFIKIN